MQQFSWRRLFVRASTFVNNLFLNTVYNTHLVVSLGKAPLSSAKTYGKKIPPVIQKLLHLRSIPVKIILCPTHPATCTRPWRTSSKIAWAPYHSGSPLSAKRNRSAMSELHNKLNRNHKKNIFS